MREQRGGGNNNNRRGGGGAAAAAATGGGNNPKQNQYTSSRSNEQSNYNRPQQQYNSRGARGNRYPDNRSSYEGRKSPSQTANDETNRPQRMNSGNYSHGPVSGPTSPSTAVPARTIYSSNSRNSASRNSPAPYTGSSSSRNNSISTTSPPPNQASNNNNKMGKKPQRSKNLSVSVFRSSMS